MLDFTSALYLGMKHPSWSLPSWDQLTLGVPGILYEPPIVTKLSGELSRLIGCRCATFAPSTLHLFWDLFNSLRAYNVKIFYDSGIYNIARWGIERAEYKGIKAFQFSHHDLFSLRLLLQEQISGRCKPIIVCDGVCPTCGDYAPLNDYYEIIRDFGGQLIIDDTQALGILGKSPSGSNPFGHGGGGSLQYHNIGGPEIVVIGSLAKGFGVPAAVMASGKKMMKNFKNKSKTNISCSPASLADYSAISRALILNKNCGEKLRTKLLRNIIFFNTIINKNSNLSDNIFPIQSINFQNNNMAYDTFLQLKQSGITTVLSENEFKNPCIKLLITSSHTQKELYKTASIINKIMNRNSYHFQSSGGLYGSVSM